MNRFGFCKQEGPVFRIRDLNSPWRSVLHLGQRQMVGKSYQWEDDPETSTFSFLEKGRVRLLNLSETGKERIVLYIEPGCLFREIVLLHVSPSHPASLVALEPCEVYNFPRTLLDDAGIAVQADNILLARHGLPPVSLAWYRDHVEVPVERYYAKLFNLDQAPFEQLAQQFMEEYHRLAPTARLAGGAREALEALQRENWP